MHAGLNLKMHTALKPLFIPFYAFLIISDKQLASTSSVVQRKEKTRNSTNRTSQNSESTASHKINQKRYIKIKSSENYNRPQKPHK